MCQKYRLFFENTKLNGVVEVIELTCLDKLSFKLSQKWIEKNLCTIVPEDQQVGELFGGGAVVGIV